MRGFFCYSPAVIKGLKKVTNLFQIGLYPRKTVKFELICQIQQETGLQCEKEAIAMFIVIRP